MSAYSAAVLALSPILYYRMDEASGNLTSIGSLAATATAAGGLTYAQPGAISDGNRAITFNGTTGQFTVADDNAIDQADGPLTYAGWFKKAANSTNMQIMCRGANGPEVRMRDSNKLEFNKSAVAVHSESSITITDTNWHSFSCSKDGATSSMYIDGVSVETIVAAQTFATNAAALTIGSNGSSQFWSGSLDELAIFGAVLTAAQVLALHRLGIEDDDGRRRRR